MKTSKSFTVNIYTPQQLFLSEDAESLVCLSTDGKIGILKNHMPAVIAVDYGVLELKHSDITTNYVTSRGFIEVFNNTVSVYVNFCRQENDPETAKAEAEKLRKSEKLSVYEHRHNEISLARIIAGSKKRRS